MEKPPFWTFSSDELLQLTKMSWIPIVRHTLIKFRATHMIRALKNTSRLGTKKSLTETVLKANRRWPKYRIINALYAE